MNPSQLKPGIYRVRHTDQGGSLVLNISVREYHGLNLVAGFLDSEKQPRKGRHKMMTAVVREWIEHMELI